MDWRRELKNAAHVNLVAPEQVANCSRDDAAGTAGGMASYRILAYRGYATAQEIRVRGRVIGNGPGHGAPNAASWWNKSRRCLMRKKRPLAAIPVELRHAGETTTVRTDDDGFYDARLRRHPDASLRCDAVSRTDGNGFGVMARHRLFAPRRDTEYIVIGDIDDTIFRVGISELWMSLKLAYLGHWSTPKPLDGVAGLYRALHGGHSGAASNPIFYVSNCRWNLYCALTHFIRINDLPDGPLLLRKPVWNKRHPVDGHKSRTVVRLLELFPRLPVVLIGDTGQRDTEIYSTIARNFPRRILAIYVRGQEMGYEPDVVADAAAAWSADKPVPLVRAPDSRRFAKHMQSIGLLSASAYGSVAGSALRDQLRARAER